MRNFQFVSRCLLIVVLAVSLTGCSKKSDSTLAPIEQTIRIINPDLNGGVYSSSLKRYFVWGADATIRWSADGIKWHHPVIPTIDAIVAMTIGEDATAKKITAKDAVIIAVDAGGLILRSTDAGNSWASVNYPAAASKSNFKHVIYIPTFNLWFVLGDKGRILNSRDQGLTWEATDLGTAMAALSLESVSLIPNTKRLLMGGDKGLLGYSDDEGKSWHLKQLEMETPITQFFYAGTRIVATAAKGKFITSDDRGETWEAFETDGQAYFKTGIYDAASHSLLLISHNGKLLRGTDDGKTWQLTPLPYEGSLNYLSDIIFDEKQNVIRVFGFGGTHLLTRDAGVTWEPQAADPLTRFQNIVFQQDTQTMISFGRGGLLARSNDHGKTWETIFPQADVYMRNSIVTAKGTWLVSGELGVILRSTDKGQSWKSINITYNDPVTPPTYRALLIEPESRAIIAAGPTGSILRSEDDGEHWQTVYYSAFDVGEAFTDVVIDKTHNTLIAVEAWGRHQRSTDGGRTWQATPSPEKREFWQAASIDSAVLLAGQQGLASRSLDGGKTWEATETADQVDWFGCFGDSSTQTFFLLGAQGKINRSSDGGKTWQSQSTGITSDLRRILREPTSGVLLAYGGQGTILRSADKGNSWQAVSSGISEELRDGVVDSTGKIFLTGQNGRIISSADNGQTWIILKTNTHNHFRSIMEDGKKLVAVGQRTLITDK